MSPRQSRLLTWLSAALVGIVCVLVFTEPPAPPPADGAPVYDRVFPDVDAAAVQTLRVDTAAGVVQASRKDGSWVLDAPVSGPADAARLDAMADSVVRLEGGRALEGDVAGYGLRPGRLIEAVLADGRTLRVRIGEDSPVSASTYFQDEAGVTRASRLRLSDTFTLLPDDLRSRAVVDLDAGAVSRVEVAGAARVLVLDKDARGGWWVEESAAPGVDAPVPPGRHRADADRVRALLAAVEGLRIEAFPSGPAAMPGGGVQITLHGAGSPAVVQLAQRDDGASMVLGPLLSAPAPAVTSAVDEVLAAPGTAWRSNLLLPIRPLTLDAVQANFGGRTVDAARTVDGWGAAQALVDALADARVDRSVPAPAVAGDPWGTVTLKAPDAAETLHIHQEAEGGRVAVDASGGAPFLVPTSVIVALEASIAAAPTP
jgi:hypothetical protein